LVGRCERGAFLWLRGFRRRSGIAAWWRHHDHRYLLRRRRSKPSPCAVPAAI